MAGTIVTTAVVLIAEETLNKRARACRDSLDPVDRLLVFSFVSSILQLRLEHTLLFPRPLLPPDPAIRHN